MCEGHRDMPGVWRVQKSHYRCVEDIKSHYRYVEGTKSHDRCVEDTMSWQVCGGYKEL